MEIGKCEIISGVNMNKDVVFHVILSEQGRQRLNLTERDFIEMLKSLGAE